jgi:hypothetical protein
MAARKKVKRETEREKYERQEKAARRLGLVTDEMLRRPRRYFRGMLEGP